MTGADLINVVLWRAEVVVGWHEVRIAVAIDTILLLICRRQYRVESRTGGQIDPFERPMVVDEVASLSFVQTGRVLCHRTTHSGGEV